MVHSLAHQLLRRRAALRSAAFCVVAGAEINSLTHERRTGTIKQKIMYLFTAVSRFLLTKFAE
jgi:hypothetical protein